jgi:serine O-acetyltransferase
LRALEIDIVIKETSKVPISATIPDWTREAKGFLEWDPSKSLLASIRTYQHLQGAGRFNLLAMIRSKLIVVKFRFWSVVTGADIPLTCKIGGGLILPHPNGVIIHPSACIGVNCLIFQQVTIGTRGGGAPMIGGQVNIGAGAKVLGEVVVGSHAKIGANAVVLDDVPDGATAIGIPATILLDKRVF